MTPSMPTIFSEIVLKRGDQEIVDFSGCRSVNECIGRMRHWLETIAANSTLAVPSHLRGSDELIDAVQRDAIDQALSDARRVLERITRIH